MSFCKPLILDGRLYALFMANGSFTAYSVDDGWELPHAFYAQKYSLAFMKRFTLFNTASEHYAFTAEQNRRMIDKMIAEQIR